jgi:7-carboxy-7-deazaguanine synthase (Cx14CxxC type)
VDRPTAICDFCDTDFVGTNGTGGGKFPTAVALADHIAEAWGDDQEMRYVVCTGGEPLLQLDESLVDALHHRKFEVAVETNGTQAAPAGIDWICVSPKAGAPLCLRTGDELKLVFPQPDFDPAQFVSLDFDHFFLQPKDGPELLSNQEAAVKYCLQHPLWKLSLQTHKLIGIP